MRGNLSFTKKEGKYIQDKFRMEFEREINIRTAHPKDYLRERYIKRRKGLGVVSDTIKDLAQKLKAKNEGKSVEYIFKKV